MADVKRSVSSPRGGHGNGRGTRNGNYRKVEASGPGLLPRAPGAKPGPAQN